MNVGFHKDPFLDLFFSLIYINDLITLRISSLLFLPPTIQIFFAQKIILTNFKLWLIKSYLLFKIG